MIDSADVELTIEGGAAEEEAEEEEEEEHEHEGHSENDYHSLEVSHAGGEGIDGNDDLAVDMAISNLITFDGHEHLLRGIPFNSVMVGSGKIFKNSAGSALTYNLSKGVKTLDYFISHNWVVWRSLKYLALAFKFNLRWALLSSAVLYVVGMALGVSGNMPTLIVAKFDYPVGYLVRITNIPIALFALFFGGRLFSMLFPHRDPLMFLDKACIHQVDKSLQKAGIQKLGAFLRSSEKMLVLLSGIYLKKLWTVYEVASFLSVHDISKLEVVPVMLAFSFTFYVGLIWSYNLFNIGIEYWDLPNWVAWVINYVGCGFYTICLRIWARSKVNLQDKIENFSVHNAQCAVESDRIIVYRNIAALQKAYGRVPRGASIEEALKVFDDNVRQQLSQQFKTVFGRFAFTHSEYVFVSTLTRAALHVDHWAKVGEGQPFREALGERCMDLYMDVIVLPAWAMLCEVFAGLYLSAPVLSWKDILYGMSANVLAAAFGNAAMELQWYWGERAKDSDTWLIAAYVLQAVLIALSFPFFHRYGSLHRRERSPQEEKPERDATESKSNDVDDEENTQKAEQHDCVVAQEVNADEAAKSKNQHDSFASQTVIVDANTDAKIDRQSAEVAPSGFDAEFYFEDFMDVVRSL